MNESFHRWGQIARRMMISDEAARKSVTIGDVLASAHGLARHFIQTPRDLDHPCWHTARYAAWAGAVTFRELGESQRLEDLRATVEAADGWLAEAGDAEGR